MFFTEREYQCLGEWSEKVQQSNPTSDTTQTFTYTYVKRVNPKVSEDAVYECFVATTIPNDPGQSIKTVTTIMLTEAGVGTSCSRLADPYKSGMKLVGTKTVSRGNFNNTIVFYYNLTFGVIRNRSVECG